MEAVEGKKESSKKAYAIGQRTDNVDEGELKLLLRDQRKKATDLREKLTETMNTFKQVNKKCKLMIKHYQRGVNYIKKTTTINPL